MKVPIKLLPIVLIPLFSSMNSSGAVTSELWGKSGESWDPKGRLPDFSRAGYHSGEKTIPEYAVKISVRDFGAAGDGLADDTEAFQKALKACEKGAVLVPAGRYKITDQLEITRPGVVLRGDGPDKSILYFPVPLNDIHPNWGATTEGRKTSNYSWSGGFVVIKGDYRSALLAEVAGKATRGATSLRVKTTEGLNTGQLVEIRVRDDAAKSLLEYLYSGDPGDVTKYGSEMAVMVAKITGIDDNHISLDRPLRFDLRPEWHPEVRRFAPTVTESGIEDIGFDFPMKPYAGHFTELGYNAIALEDVADCWVRGVHIVNSDSGLFVNGCFCTITDVVFDTHCPPDDQGRTGHHGIYFHGQDNLYSHFRYNQIFIHDITVSRGCIGNVIADGSGIDLSLDHHKRAPYENLFTDIDAGAGNRVWLCGGGAQLGKHSAARETFWNIRARQPIPYPPPEFGPVSMNFVGLFTDQPAVRNPNGKWLEPLDPKGILPTNLYQAQLKRRMTEAR